MLIFEKIRKKKNSSKGEKGKKEESSDKSRSPRLVEVLRISVAEDMMKKRKF